MRFSAELFCIILFTAGFLYPQRNLLLFPRSPDNQIGLSFSAAANGDLLLNGAHLIHSGVQTRYTINRDSLLITDNNSHTGIIEGKVTDKSTKQPIPSVNVLLINTGLGASTDINGRFRINNILVGRYELRASAIGYETVSNSDVIVSTGHSVSFEIELSESVIPIGREVIIKGELYRKDPSLFTSSHTLNFEEIRRHPGGAEDISRVLLSLPGVMTSSDDRNDLIVRGGNPTEILNLIDNIEIPNLNHFGTQGASGGPIGMINNNFIREVNFSSGGFPVKYGERLSSVLDIRLKEGNRERMQGTAILNIAGAGLQFEGPLLSGGSWMISARKSYLDIVKKLNTTALTVVPNFTNYQAKLVYDLNAANQLSLVLLGGLDRVFFAEGEYNLNSFFKDYLLRHNQDQFAGGLNLRTLWSKESYSIVTLSNSYNHYYSDVIKASDKSLFYRNSSYEREAHLKGEYNYKFSQFTEASAGAGFKLINFNHGLNYIGDTLYNVTGGDVDTVVYEPVNYFSGENTSKKFVFVQVTQWVGGKFKLAGGLRWDNFEFIDNSDAISYRLGGSYYFTPVTNVSLFYGIVYQTPPYIWLSSDVSSRMLKNMKAAHWIAGIEHLFSEDIKLSVEAYIKNYTQIPVSRNIPQFIASNGGTDYGAFIIRKLSSDGKGYSQGIEFTLQKKLLNSFYGIISYGYSKLRFTALDGVERDGSFDYRHVFTFAAGFVPREDYELSIKWRYAGGRPYTPFDPVLSTALHKGVEDFTQLNTLRYPSYHRLDIRFDYRWHFSKFNLVSYIDLQNAYARYNVYEYQWDVKENKQVAVYQWRLFPVGGFSLEF